MHITAEIAREFAELAAEVIHGVTVVRLPWTGHAYLCRNGLVVFHRTDATPGVFRYQGRCTDARRQHLYRPLALLEEHPQRSLSDMLTLIPAVAATKAAEVII